MDQSHLVAGIDTQLDSSLIKAYLETNYGVNSEGDQNFKFDLNVGAPSANLIATHNRYGVDCSAYITPCNPFGEVLSDTENETQLFALRTRLQKRSLHWLEGIGVHPNGQWPGEQSYLILGLSLESAKLLATELAQNAFVWAGRDGTPKLVLLR